MTCNNCGSENVQGASFCTRCGKPLGQLCYCSFVLRPGDLYCGGCGRPVENIKAQVEDAEETKVIRMIHQFSKSEIDKLIKESILVKAGKEIDLDQNDIDEFFDA